MLFRSYIGLYLFFHCYYTAVNCTIADMHFEVYNSNDSAYEQLLHHVTPYYFMYKIIYIV